MLTRLQMAAVSVIICTLKGMVTSHTGFHEVKVSSHTLYSFFNPIMLLKGGFAGTVFYAFQTLYTYLKGKYYSIQIVQILQVGHFKPHPQLSLASPRGNCYV